MNYDYRYVDPKVMAITKKAAETDYFSDKALTVRPLEKAVLLPGRWWDGGGIVCDGRYIKESYLTSSLNWAHAYPFDEKDVVQDDREVVYVGMMHRIWGHNITDNMKFFWYLFDEKVPEHIRKLPMVYAAMRDSTEVPESFKRMLAMLGIRFEQLERINVPTRFKKIYMPDECFFCEGQERRYTKEYVSMIDRVCAQIEPDTSIEKLYYSRQAMKNKFWYGLHDIGERDIQNVFEKNGFVSVSPETLPIEKQIALLKGCKVFATTEGSASHNVLFMNPGSEVVYVRKIGAINQYQYPLNQMRDINVTIIDSNLSNFPRTPAKPEIGPFFLYVNRRMAAYGGVKAHFPLFSYLVYARQGIVTRIKQKIPKNFKNAVKKALGINRA